MSDSCATTPPPPSSGDYANVIINCQCSLFNDSSSRLLNTPNHRYVTKIAIQVHRCVSKLLILRRGCATSRGDRIYMVFFLFIIVQCALLFDIVTVRASLGQKRSRFSTAKRTAILDLTIVQYDVSTSSQKTWITKQEVFAEEDRLRCFECKSNYRMGLFKGKFRCHALEETALVLVRLDISRDVCKFTVTYTDCEHLEGATYGQG